MNKLLERDRYASIDFIRTRWLRFHVLPKDRLSKPAYFLGMESDKRIISANVPSRNAIRRIRRADYYAKNEHILHSVSSIFDGMAR